MSYPYKAAVAAARNRNKAYEAVIQALEKIAQDKGLTRKQIADALGRSAPHISRCLSGPSNWTLDTVSDLLFAIGAEMDYLVVFNEDRQKSNYFHPASTETVQQDFSKVPTTATSARTVTVVDHAFQD